jgi:hypothetical protein
MVFPIAVFFVFAASSLAVLMLSSRIYDTTSSAASGNYSSRTAFAYVSEKIRQNDANGGISVTIRDDVECLTLQEDGYATYIYALDGMLKELRLRDGVDAALSSGQDIVPVQNFSIRETQAGLYHFDITSEDGTAFSIVASERSAP